MCFIDVTWKVRAYNVYLCSHQFLKPFTMWWSGAYINVQEMSCVPCPHWLAYVSGYSGVWQPLDFSVRSRHHNVRCFIQSEKNGKTFLVLSLLWEELQIQVQGSLILRASSLTSAKLDIKMGFLHTFILRIEFQTSYWIPTNYYCIIFMIVLSSSNVL